MSFEFNDVTTAVMGAVSGITATLFGVKAIGRKDRQAAAEAGVGVAVNEGIQAEILRLQRLAERIAPLTERVTELESSILSISLLLEAMSYDKDCVCANSSIMRKIKLYVSKHVKRDSVTHEPEDELHPSIRAEVDEFFDKMYAHRKEREKEK